VDLFKYPLVYDSFHSWKTDDIDFITSQAKSTGGPVLELAAGTARLGFPIAKEGLEYTGLELSREYVDCGKKKLKDFPRAQVIEGDMRNFGFDEKFNFMFIGFNSLYHLQTEKEIKDCFTACYENLNNDGTFLVDIFLPDPFYLHRDPNEESELLTFEHPEKKSCTVFEKGSYTMESQVLHVTWRFEYKDQLPSETYEFDMHILFPDNMDRLLSECGWTIQNKYGDYDKSGLSEESPKQIYICTK